jgi:hypothetical protein
MVLFEINAGPYDQEASMGVTAKAATQNVTRSETKEQRRGRLGDPLTMDVPDAGYKYYGLGRSASYEAANTGLIPTIRVGNLRRVPIAAMDRKIAEAAG